MPINLYIIPVAAFLIELFVLLSLIPYLYLNYLFNTILRFLIIPSSG